MNSSRLFTASRIALIVTAMSFALRGAALDAWHTQFHLTNEQLGWINGTAFWGFTLAMVFGGPLCDVLGLGRFIGIAFAGHLAAIALTITAHGYAQLYVATLCFGIANGAVEAACNPLITTLFPTDKTTKLNQFHVWYPGGTVIGGLWAYFAAKAGWDWQIQFAAMFIPLAIYAVMFWGQGFPKTERVQRGFSTGQMWAACFRPGFILMVVCMLFTASTEFGPNQWIPDILAHAGVSGILVLVWITGLMALGRQCAGAVVHRMPASGVLTCSAVLSAIGLYAMSCTSGALMFVSASIFAAGVCFFWPTMLGRVSERYPATGALGLAVMGGAGMLAPSVVLPYIGKIYDAKTAAGLPEVQAGLLTLRDVVVLPLILAVVFLGMLIMERRKGAPGVIPAEQHV